MNNKPTTRAMGRLAGPRQRDNGARRDTSSSLPFKAEKPFFNPVRRQQIGRSSCFQRNSQMKNPAGGRAVVAVSPAGAGAAGYICGQAADFFRAVTARLLLGSDKEFPACDDAGRFGRCQRQGNSPFCFRDGRNDRSHRIL